MSGLQFKPELARKIVRGEKTQTRRPVKADLQPRWKVGRTYAVQPGRGKPALCRVEILDIRQEPVGAITYDDARLEGFRTTDEFKRYWLTLYDKAWVTEWETTAPSDGDEHELVHRFDRLHGGRPVWVVTFKLDETHVPRLLAARPAPDYVTDPRLALPLEPEAITDDDWERHVKARRDRTAVEWLEVEEQQRALDRRMLSQEQRIARLQREAHLRGVDVKREVWLLRRRLPTLAGAALERHIRGVEARIYKTAA